ncbi:MAG TPA: WhiB family transcriptional regulator [Streptosporangiaceae bacterium]|jgi:WhiB family redox-sensing transcriptional regulator
MTVLLSDEWWDLAACRDAEPEVFFPISATAASRDTVQRAKAVCSSCPVQSQCLRYALRHRQEQGIWGGLTEDERRLLSRRLARNERAATRSDALRTRAGAR